MLFLLPQALHAKNTDENIKSLKDAFQNEYVYLTSQKAVLLKQKEQLNKKLSLDISTIKSEIRKMQKNLVWLSAENDEKQEYLSNLESKKRNLQKRYSSLENLYKKSNKTLKELSARLNFKSLDMQTEAVAPNDVNIDDFADIITEAQNLLQSSFQAQTFSAAFFNDDQLVNGTITRLGLSVAIGKVNGEHYALGPDGSGMLKTLELTDDMTAKSGMNLFVFEGLNKVAKVKKNAGVLEFLADLSPILFLGMLLLMVLGLFMAMMRV